MKTTLLIVLLSITLLAQERVLLHINRNGQQEAIPLKKGERVQDVIERIENEKAMIVSPSKPNGLIDTLKYYPNDASLTTNFGFTRQDVALQWYTPAAGGKVKEFWWRNYEAGGTIRKATIRAWKVDQKLATRPSSVLTKHLGYYKDPNDGEGQVTPFKPANGDQWFYSNGKSDSALWNFDPLGSEVTKWLPGGIQVSVDSNVWQGIRLSDWGNDSMLIKLGELFGFTLQNDSRVTDIRSGAVDERLELLSYANSNPSPYHSYKFYELGRTDDSDKGWHLRGDYEWGMYAVVEYCTDCDPRPGIRLWTYSTTLLPDPRKICATITDDNPGGGNTVNPTVYLKYRIGSIGKYDSTMMIATGSTYCAYTPSAKSGDTIYWYIVSTDVNGNRTETHPLFYRIHKKSQDRLFIYNNAQYSLGIGALIYANSSTKYDRWSAPNDGTGELTQLLAMYDKVVLADGSFPARNVFPAVSAWMAQASATVKRNLFYSSQDYGCYIQGACADTTFPIGSFEEKYLGVSKLGPQDQGSTTRPVKITPQTDTITNYIIKYNADSATTLWHYPTFELGFSAYPDFMTKTTSAKALFTDGGTNVYGVRNSGTGFNTVFLALDAGALQFRGDTSKHNAGYTTVDDPKYQWIVDVKSLANVFMDAVTDVKQEESNIPTAYTLRQNYPNPFNPTTTIEYSVAGRNHVTIVIYNTLGQKVATVVNETKDAGTHSAAFNAQSLASGLYFYEMRAGSFVSVKKMLLMK